MIACVPVCMHDGCLRLPMHHAWCYRRWGIRYNTISYWPAWAAMLGNLDEVGRHYWSEAAAKGVTKVKMG